MDEDFDRPDILRGRTYKFVPPVQDQSAMYLTISHDDDGVLREVFINSKKVEYFEWMTMGMLCLSYILQMSNDFPTDLIEDLEGIASPNSSYWLKGRHYSSIVSHMAHIIHEHYIQNAAEVMKEANYVEDEDIQDDI